MTLEQRMERLETQNKRLTAALTLMAVAICAVVTVAGTVKKSARFDTVIAREFLVKNQSEKTVVSIEYNAAGSGLIRTHGPDGNDLVKIFGTRNSYGIVTTYQPDGEQLVSLGVNTLGNGAVSTYGYNGKPLVRLNSGPGGGSIGVHSETGRFLAEIYPSERGNGGAVRTYGPNGIPSVYLASHSSGGHVEISNKTGEAVTTIYADESENGEFDVWTRNDR